MVFNNRQLRHEHKYIISKVAAETLKPRLDAVMTRDKNAVGGGSCYRVTSLYFDNIYRSSYNDKLAGVNRRSKFRVRAYNLDPAALHLEVKYKDDGYASKTRVPLTPEQYGSILKGDYSFGKGEEFASTAIETLVISEKLTLPRPCVLVDYLREAYVYVAGNIRITLDSGLSTSFHTLDMFSARYSRVMGESVILEIKYGSFIPSHIAEIFSGLPLYKEAVSKFIICTDKLMEVKKQCIL